MTNCVYQKWLNIFQEETPNAKMWSKWNDDIKITFALECFLLKCASNLCDENVIEDWKSLRKWYSKHKTKLRLKKCEISRRKSRMK